MMHLKETVFFWTNGPLRVGEEAVHWYSGRWGFNNQNGFSTKFSIILRESGHHYIFSGTSGMVAQSSS